MATAAKKATARRRKVIHRASHVGVPVKYDKLEALSRLSTPELKNMARAANVRIPKYKDELVRRLAECEAVSVAVTTEAVVFGPPGAPRAV